MIAAVGVDMIEIERVGRVVERHGDRFLRRVFTDDELAESAGRRDRLAGRFAAKEAILKVLRTGLAAGITWKDVRVHSGKDGEPIVTLTGEALAKARALGIDTVHLSISHDTSRAIAFAVGEGKG